MKVKFGKWDCETVVEEYMNGRICIELYDEEGPVATATINLPYERLAKDEAAIKTYSENEGMLMALMKAGIVKDVVRYANSGFVEIPICKIDLRKLDVV